MTIRELYFAVEGYMEAHGMQKGPDYDELLDMLDNDTPTTSIKNKPGTRKLFGGT